MLLKCEKHNNYHHTSLLTSAKSPCYRYGFNGMEKDDEHTQGKYDFGARIYDSRLGQFLSVDPKYRMFSNQSTYLFAANNPIFYIDVEGEHKITYYTIITDHGTAKFKVIKYNNDVDWQLDNCYGGGFEKSYSQPATSVTIDTRTNISEEDNLSKTVDFDERITKSEYNKQKAAQKHWWDEENFKGSGDGSISGGISFTSKKGEGTGLTSDAKDTQVIDIDDMLAPGAGAPIRNVTKLWKILAGAKDVLGGLDNGKKIAEEMEKHVPKKEPAKPVVDDSKSKIDTTQCNTGVCKKLHTSDGQTGVEPAEGKKVEDYPVK